MGPALFRLDAFPSLGGLNPLIREPLVEYIRRSGLFDPHAYRLATGLTGLSERAMIRDYLARPANRRPSPQPLFDMKRYRGMAAVGEDADPFLHFLVRGHPWPDGLSAAFDKAAYLHDNPDVRLAGWEATHHYVEQGWREGRLDHPAPAETFEPDFTGLPGRAHAPDVAGGSVDVVIPVYRGREETLAAIHSVLSAKTAAPFRLVVIDDATPEPMLSRDLEALEARGLIFRLVNPTNRGFTVTANQGLTLDRRRDVILLNADAQVYDHWLDRLRAAAYSSTDVGTVTPLSNAATILSYPIRLRDNPAPLELSYPALAGLANELASPPVEIPTGVGFCIYVRRDCLDRVGVLDERAFPRGYGEENDFCLRATRLGWRHLAATDTFVRHLGSRSFGADRPALVAQGLKVLEDRHPGYQALIGRFLVLDPLAEVRANLDMARIRAAGHSGRLVHGQVPEVAEGTDLILRRVSGRSNDFRVHSPLAMNTPNLPRLDPMASPEVTGRILVSLRIEEILVHEPDLFGRRQVDALKVLAGALGIAFREG